MDREKEVVFEDSQMIVYSDFWDEDYSKVKLNMEGSFWEKLYERIRIKKS